MKKLLIALLAAIMASGAFAQTPFPDIPENHWAEDAVARIADLGIVIGFPDGTFRGNEAFTRYQAALVISRLLDVINANMEAMGAMTEADIASLRNALQELASDLAAQGVRVAALESAIAGISDDIGALQSDVGQLRSEMDQFGNVRSDLDRLSNGVAGLGDDVASNSARIAELEAMMDEMMGRPTDDGMDEEVLRDLQNQIAALRVNADTAAAQAEAAAAAANAAQSAANAAQDAANAAQAAANAANTRAGAALAQANENAAQIAAVNSVLNLLNDRLTELESAFGGMEPGGDTIMMTDDEAIARNASDIANIREFVILLRRDQVALRDAVSALQDSDAAQTAAIADLEDRVTALEENPLGLTGTITFSYYVGRVDGNPFDIDRAYGVNNERSMGNSVFSTGAQDLDGDDSTNEVGERAQDLQDIERASGNFDVDLDLTLRNGLVLDGTGSPNSLNSFQAVVSFDFETIYLIDEDETIFVLTSDEYMLIADFIGADPITLILGEDVEVTFTANIVDLDANFEGYLLHLGTPEFLAFANPELWIFYLTDTDGVYYRGIRGTASFIDGIGGGVSYAQRTDTMGDDKDDVDGDNVTTTVLGVDAYASIGPVDLIAEWATSDDAGTPVADSLLIVEVEIDLGSIGVPILDELWAAYVNITDGFFDGDEDTNPALASSGSHRDDQNGFYVEASLDIFGLLDLDAYVDSYSLNSSATSTFAFGVDAEVGLPLGFALTAFYHSAAINGIPVDDQDSGVDGDENVVVADVDRDNNRNTGFGVGLVHDGDGPNALIDNLDLEFAYEMTEADLSNTYILAAADYELTISIVTLTPYVTYESDIDADGGTDDTTTIMAGTGLETAALDIFLRPSLEAAVNYRTTSHADADTYTATELQYSVGLHLNEFLMEHTTLTLKYGSWTGTNINDDGRPGLPPGNPAPNCRNVDCATNISGGDENNGVTQSVNGYEVIINFYDAEFAYGAYLHSDGSSAQAFSISYVIEW